MVVAAALSSRATHSPTPVSTTPTSKRPSPAPLATQQQQQPQPQQPPLLNHRRAARMLGRAAALRHTTHLLGFINSRTITTTTTMAATAPGAAAAAAAAAAAPPPASAPSSSAAPNTLETLPFDNDFLRSVPADPDSTNEVRVVRGALFTRVRPTPPGGAKSSGGPRMLSFSPAAAALLGLSPAELSRPEAALAFSGALPLPGSDPYATCYGGHQFGNWAGQLGDGRAIALGEVSAPPPPASAEAAAAALPAGSGPVPPPSLAAASALGLICAGAPALGAHPLPRPDRWEVQLKGAGMTPFSRRADGRAVLRSSLRELVASEALAALGVPTTRALCLVATGDPVLRDMFYDGNAKFEPGAVTTRLAPSFVRFGHFELPASRGGKEAPLVRKLADFVIRAHYPHLLAEHAAAAAESQRAFGGGGQGDERAEEAAERVGEEEEEEEKAGASGGASGENNASGKNKAAGGPPGSALYAAWLGEVAERTGRLAAAMQSVGFVNGVLNTDNSSVLGLAIDFGPFGFLDAYDVGYTPNTTDLPGRRYAYGRQPAVLQWNCLMLANALYASGVVSREDAERAVGKYAPALMEAYEGWTARKLGFSVGGEKKTAGGGGDGKSGKSDGGGNGDGGGGGPLAGALLEAMQQDKADFTNTWRALASVPLEPEARENEGGLPLALERALASSPTALSDPARLASWRQWLGAWRAALRAEGGASADDARRQALQRSVSPKYVPRQHLLQEAIAAAESGDETELERLLAAVTRPYDEQDGSDGGPVTDAKYASPPPPAFSCMLSCSS